MLVTILILAAFILFVVEAIRTKSLIAAGLACGTASLLVPLLG